MKTRNIRSFISLFAAGLIVISCAGGQRDPGVSSVMDINVPDSERRVISVAPFDDRSIGTEDYKPWSQGIPDMVMESFMAIPYYRVIARDNALRTILKEQEFQLVGATDPDSVVRLGRLLNAQFIVQGSFAVFRETLQINAQVLCVETGEAVNAVSVQGSLDSFYRLQNEIAIRVTDGMNLHLSEEARAELIERRDTSVVQASLANYRGEQRLEQAAVMESRARVERTRELRDEARRITDEARVDFEEALSHDEDYERARRNLSRLARSIPMTI